MGFVTQAKYNALDKEYQGLRNAIIASLGLEAEEDTGIITNEEIIAAVNALVADGGESSEADQTVETLQNEVADLRAQATEKDNTISTLQTEKKEAEDQLAAANKTIEQKDAELAELGKQPDKTGAEGGAENDGDFTNSDKIKVDKQAQMYFKLSKVK